MASTLENNSVSKSISELYLQSKLVDVHFAFTTDDGIVKVPAHKAILAIASPVFEAMFFGPMKESDVVEIVDFSASAFEEFLQFFYLAKVTISLENMGAVVRLADKYDINECINNCVTLLESKLSKENVIWGYQLAIALNNQSLEQLCQTVIEKFTYAVIKSKEFRHCDKTVLDYILKLESFCCIESDLFTACFKWAKSSCKANGLDENDPKNVRNQLGDLFHLFRFETLTNYEIAVIISDEQKIRMFSYDELADLFCIKSDNEFEPKAFTCIKRSGRGIKWNSEQVLTCDIGQGALYQLNSAESTWFSVNAPALLGVIGCTYIQEYQSMQKVNISSKMSIVEYEQQPIPPTGACKVLHKTVVQFTTIESPSVKLPKPIVIHPGKMYEICFEVQTREKQYAHYAPSQFDFELDEDVAVELHGFLIQKGLVSSLSFNRI